MLFLARNKVLRRLPLSVKCFRLFLDKQPTMRLLTPEPSLFVWTAFCFLLLFLWYWALREIVQRRFAGGNDKLIWVLIVLFMPALGILLYFSIGRKNRLTDNLK